MILIIDNYDSFTYNLVQYVGAINKNIKIIKNDELTINEINSLNVSHVIISPGPGNPKNTGICKDVVNYISIKIPTLGICLGMQLIGSIYQGNIVKSQNIMHGKSSIVKHNRDSVLFKNIPTSFEATRYHSLCIEEKFNNKNIKITARTNKNEIMAIEHIKYPIYGVQFHPESILTKHGNKIIENFLNIVV
tara:strand:+ start:118 stop:690 length:573 start_codon:yes stop_codon:yes gene_type:complete